MWGRSERVNANLRELVPTRRKCHFKEFGAIFMICYYIAISRCASIFQQHNLF